MMVELTKQRLNVQRGSLVEKIVADRVEDYSSAPWWEKLLDVLSLALIFVPGGAILETGGKYRKPDHHCRQRGQVRALL